MKCIYGLVCVAFLAGSPAFAQKSKVKAAANYLKDSYQQYDKAKEAIDEAVANEQTRNSAEAWYYRGRIYSVLYKHEKFGSLCDSCLQEAYSSFRKSLELEPQGDKAVEINALHIPVLAQKILEEGASYYNNKEYSKALTAFESVLRMMPDDTTAMKYSAFAAQYAGNAEQAKYYYERLLAKGVQDPDFYISISNYYRGKQENQKALDIIRKGRAVYPDTLTLMYNEINVLLAMENSQEAADVIATAIAKDPNNESLYLVLGNNYEKLANPKDANGAELPKPANSAEMMKLALDVYQKGLAVNPNNYGLNFNLGAYYFNAAAEQINAANKMSSETEADKLRKLAVQNFKGAQPYLEKALQVNPRASEEDLSVYESTVASLKELYARTGQMDLYNQLNEKMPK